MFRHWLSLIRFSHTLFALPFALLAAAMAWTAKAHDSGPAFSWRELAGILVCMVGARSAAMTFNRLVDDKIDAQNPRTATRHLPAGLVSRRAAWALTAASSTLFVGGTLLFLPNWLPLALSIPVLSFLCGYSFAKRFTSLSHFWLGGALMLAPICAWIAIRGQSVLAAPSDLLPAVLLGFGVLLWVAGFDIIYACQDEEFDRRHGLHSIPARLGVAKALRVAALCHTGTIIVLAALPLVYPHLGWLYWTGLAAVAGLLAFEHWLVRPDDLSRVNAAFFQVNAVIGLGLLAVSTLELLLAGR